ncbi:MAG: carbohydrate kinase family protein [Clostridia bacterium]|nr:carbohydrate kinase family protein [Clostridia bacterium]
MFDTVCLGHICCDILVKPLNTLPERGKLSLTENFKMLQGGCAANTAIDLAKLGLKSGFVGKVGGDGFGDFLKAVLRADGVGTEYVVTASEEETSASLVAIGDDGERSVVHAFGTNATFCLEDIDLSFLNETKILFVGGAMLLPAFDGVNSEELLRQARDRNILCCMDTAWDSTGKWMEKIGGSLKYLDWFLPSYEEAVCLAGGEKKPEAIANIFMGYGVKNVVIKLGYEGCFVKPQDGDGFYSKGYKKIRAVDTSGAGDSFCAGFLAGFLKGWDIPRCAQFANAVGTFCVQEIGTTKGVKPMNEILRFMESYTY